MLFDIPRNKKNENEIKCITKEQKFIENDSVHDFCSEFFGIKSQFKYQSARGTEIELCVFFFCSLLVPKITCYLLLTLCRISDFFTFSFSDFAFVSFMSRVRKEQKIKPDVYVHRRADGRNGIRTKNFFKRCFLCKCICVHFGAVCFQQALCG